MSAPQKFPVRLHGYGALVVIQLPEPMGGRAKIYLRDVAKDRVPKLYHLPIETGICGQTDTGKEIPINTVGRWLFGTPGYMGHVRVDGWEGILAKVEFPKDSPSVVRELIDRLKAVVEGTDDPSDSEAEGVLERAMRLVKERKPKASLQKKAAFANTVQYLVTGWSGGFGGPSVREHAASHKYGGRRYTFEEATKLLLRDDGPIFGPITDLHRSCWEEEYCFDDDPSDVEQLES